VSDVSELEVGRGLERLNRLGRTLTFSNIEYTHPAYASVYGTAGGFDGTARPGASLSFDNAWEYSLTRNWVLATDFYYRHDEPTSVRDANGIRRTSSFDTFAFVPAVEYNWSARIGVIVGARYIAARGNNPRSLTPIVALSVFM